MSGVDVVVGDDPVYFGAENTTPVPKKHVLGAYSSTKYSGELIATQANGRPLANGISYKRGKN